MKTLLVLMLIMSTLALYNEYERSTWERDNYRELYRKYVSLEIAIRDIKK